MKRIKKILKRKQSEPAAPGRITNETVAEHREQILAGGRRFKYPVQYSKHKLIINSILISVAVVVLMIGLGWWQLYKVQNSSKFMYRVTQVVPAPVAVVDGWSVRYSDYLRKLRSSLYFLQRQDAINIKSEDGKRQIEFIKRRELDSAVKDGYVAKIASQENIKVSGKEVDDFINKVLEQRNVSLSAYERTVLSSYYDWSLEEYRSVVRAELLRRKVSFAVDSVARQRIQEIQAQIAGGADFAVVAKEKSDDLLTKPSGGDSGTVALSSQDPDGLVARAAAMPIGQVSSVIEGSDGYFIIKLTAKTDTTVQFSLIKVSLTELNRRFDEIKKQSKIHEYIKVNSQS